MSSPCELTVAVFARGLRGLAVEVTVVDDAVLRWLAGLQAPGLVGAWRALAAISSWWVIIGLLAGCWWRCGGSGT